MLTQDGGCIGSVVAEAIGENRSNRQRFNEAVEVLSGAVQGAESGMKALRWLSFISGWERCARRPSLVSRLVFMLGRFVS